MAVSTFVTVNILAAVASPTQPSFNIGGVLGYHLVWTDRSRSYTSAANLNLDFVSAQSSSATATAGIAAAGAAFFAQSPNPGVFKVFRSTVQSTKVFTILMSAAKDSTAYTFLLANQAVTFTSGAGTTAVLIATGLVAAANALAITGVSAANGGGASATITITGTAGTWYSVDVTGVAGDLLGMQVTETTADPGYATELAAIALADAAWYGLTCVDHSKAVAIAVAAWAEANTKVYFMSSQDWAVYQAGGTDVINTFKTNAYNRSSAMFHHNPGTFPEAALMGFFFVFTPGSANYFAKTLAGVAATPFGTLNDSGVVNVLAKNGNVYRVEAGINVFYNGTMGSGRFIDITTGIDYMTARLQNRLYASMVNAQKIPYTTAGAATVEALIRAQIKEEIDIGFAADDSNISVTIPAIGAQASTDRAARIMRNCNFTFRAAGAVQSVVINGTVTT